MRGIRPLNVESSQEFILQETTSQNCFVHRKVYIGSLRGVFRLRGASETGVHAQTSLHQLSPSAQAHNLLQSRPYNAEESVRTTSCLENKMPAGVDDVTANIDFIAPCLDQISGAVWETEAVPGDRRTASRQLFLPQGDKTENRDYRAISRIDLAA